MERSILAVPGGSAKMQAKALASKADGLFLDLEDAVAPAAKVAARAIVVQTLNDADWGAKRRVIRINALDSPFWYDDLLEVVLPAIEKIDALIVPKVNSEADIQAVAAVLERIEEGHGRQAQIGIEAQVETARGLVNVEQIAQASARLESLVFGPGDFAASTGMPGENIGAFDQWEMAYGHHRWHYVMTRILVAARAFGLRAIDGPYAHYRDHTGLRRSTMLARALGYDGKWCIHPGQVEPVNVIFTPTVAEITWASEVLLAWDAAVAAGRGAVGWNGQMLDMATVRMARRVIERS